jgi:hypothetical protein
MCNKLRLFLLNKHRNPFYTMKSICSIFHMAALPKSDEDNDSEEDDVTVMIGKDEGKVLSP